MFIEGKIHSSISKKQSFDWLHNATTNFLSADNFNFRNDSTLSASGIEIERFNFSPLSGFHRWSLSFVLPIRRPFGRCRDENRHVSASPWSSEQTIVRCTRSTMKDLGPQVWISNWLFCSGHIFWGRSISNVRLSLRSRLLGSKIFIEMSFRLIKEASSNPFDKRANGLGHGNLLPSKHSVRA